MKLDHLELVLGVNGCSNQKVARAVRPKRQGELSKNKEKENLGFSCFSYIHSVTDRIDKIVQKAKVQIVFIPTRRVHKA